MAVVLHCPRCGRENRTGTSYCEHCLAELAREETGKVLFCPECHAENPYTNEFCDICHEPLKPGQTND
ncbi:MAG: zinc ribbon domain-containing protein [Nitrospirae bacterium]|nr:zinc ribbon domain-containing protein [Nitrospirota bacterium]